MARGGVQREVRTIMGASPNDALGEATSIRHERRNITSIIVESLATINETVMLERGDTLFHFDEQADASVQFSRGVKMDFARDSVLESVETRKSGSDD